MKKVIKLNETDLETLVKKALKEQIQEPANYMFFSNLQQIRRQCDMLLELDPQMIDEIIKTVTIGLMTTYQKPKPTWTKFLIS